MIDSANHFSTLKNEQLREERDRLQQELLRLYQIVKEQKSYSKTILLLKPSKYGKRVYIGLACFIVLGILVKTGLFILLGLVALCCFFLYELYQNFKLLTSTEVNVKNHPGTVIDGEIKRLQNRLSELEKQIEGPTSV